MATRTYCDLCGDEIRCDRVELKITEDGFPKVKKDICSTCLENLHVRREDKKYVEPYTGELRRTVDFIIFSVPEECIK